MRPRWTGLLLVILTFGCLNIQAQVPQEKNKDHPDLKKHDTLSLHQQNGPELQVVGYGRLYLSYSETVDGYTILRNDKGVYEYAERGSDGDLKPSGVVAHDPGERERKEILLLKKTPKHLRYKKPKLDEILNKKSRFPRIDND